MLLTGTPAVAVTITSDSNTPSNVATSCASLPASTKNACYKCFFGSNAYDQGFRTADQINYDSDTNICEVIDDSDDYEYIYSWHGCQESNMWTEAYDSCEMCMKGQNNEIVTVDGFGNDNDYSGIEFYFNWDTMGDFNCDIVDSRLISCASGWYGFPESDGGNPLMGCNKCPATGLSNVSASSSITYGRRNSITDCYISANTPIQDNVGTYVYTSDCHYK